MAMTKREQARFEAMATVAALRWTALPAAGELQPDIPPPQSGASQSLTTGWLFNKRTRKVFKAWSDSYSHGHGEPPGKERLSSSIHGAAALYSTEIRALQALRQAMDREAAAALRVVDRLIEAATAGAVGDG